GWRDSRSASAKGRAMEARPIIRSPRRGGGALGVLGVLAVLTRRLQPPAAADAVAKAVRRLPAHWPELPVASAAALLCRGCRFSGRRTGFSRQSTSIE